MAVVKGLAIEFDPVSSLRRRGRDPSKVFGPGVSPEAYRRALEATRELIRPAFCYAVHPVLGVDAGRLLIAQGQTLESPVVAALFAPAPEVVLLVYTIGPDLDARARELQREGQQMASFLLDRMGALALQEVGAVAYAAVEELARSKDVRASIPLNPGTTHWPASGQRVFQALCPLEEIGVSVTPSLFLVPYKTISMAIALGPEVLTPDRGSSCDYCETRHLCEGHGSARGVISANVGADRSDGTNLDRLHRGSFRRVTVPRPPGPTAEASP